MKMPCFRTHIPCPALALDAPLTVCPGMFGFIHFNHYKSGEPAAEEERRLKFKQNLCVNKPAMDTT